MPGELYLFAGRAEGDFAAGRVLASSEGKPLRVGRASWPCACDWDGDGDLDLVAGNMWGKLFLVRNGGKGALDFADPVPLVSAGTTIEIEETNAAPCVADWDQDGASDLVLGTGDGTVLFYRNTRSAAGRGEPELAAPIELLPHSPDGDAALRLAHPGQRARVAVCDWNADGRLDLVVGEHAAEDGPPVQRTKAQERELEAAIKEGLALAERRGELERTAFARWLGAKGIPPAQSKEHYDDFLLEWLATPEAHSVTDRQAELTALQRKLNPALIEHGRLWVFLRQGK